MKNTALGQTRMANIPQADFGGGIIMIKVRVQGTTEEIKWFEKELEDCPKLKITESSELFKNKGTNKYFRKYLEINKTDEV